MSFSDVISVIALLVALTSLVHTHVQSMRARDLIVEEKRTSLIDRMKSLSRELRRGQRALSIMADALDRDSGFREFCERSIDENDVVTVYRQRAAMLDEEAQFIEGALKRLASQTKADVRQIRLSRVVGPAALENLVGDIRGRLIDAESDAVMAEGLLQSHKELADEYRTIQGRTADVAEGGTNA